MPMARTRGWVCLVAFGLGLVLASAALTRRFGRPGARAEEKASPGRAKAPGGIDRTVLPVPEPKHEPITEADARKAKAPPRFEVKAPRGAPNVVVVLLDDMGFGQPSAFGGPVHMPTAERLARNGLRYNRFHTAALCSPTRAALLTGRNHHSCNMGVVAGMATAFPGNTGVRPHGIAPLAEVLRLNGYSTAAFGKSHETPPWEVSPSGPTDRWPTRCGFDKFYGFLAAETNQYNPLVYDGMVRVTPPRTADYHFTTDMTNQAVAWMRMQKTLTPEKPFFVYFAPGAVHAPHHAPKEWIAKYKGRFDTGWDALREQTLARQKKLAVVPPETRLAPKPKEIKDWDKLTADEKKLFARQMEVFAGFGEHTDHEVGRLVKALEEMNQMDNTLFLYILGDNGASAEGGMNGRVNELTFFNGVEETVADQLKRLDDLGGPMAYNHYAAGWAVAGNTPFQWAKQVASNFGGMRNGMVVHWPGRIKAKGEIRPQFHHVIDVAPTILEACGLSQPRSVNGSPQRPIEGVSMVYSFADGRAKDRHVTQYFEMVGNRAIYHDGWLAGTVHKKPWAAPEHPLEEDVWELYHVAKDFSMSDDLARRRPGKLKEMRALFTREAVKYNVLPIDDRFLERINPAVAGRPVLLGARTSFSLYPGMTGLMESAFPNVKNRSHAILAEVEVPKGGAEGVIVCQGGRFGGWSLYVKAGKVKYVYNHVGLRRYVIASEKPIPPGKATIRFEFTSDGGKAGSGGKGRLLVNGSKVAEGRIEKTNAHFFSTDETAGVGQDDATPVTEEYKEGDNRFTGRIHKVTIDLK
jgi:arylsulfatase